MALREMPQQTHPLPRMKTYTLEDFKRWGALGGTKSRRTLTAKQAKAMVKARESKRKPKLEQT